MPPALRASVLMGRPPDPSLHPAADPTQIAPGHLLVVLPPLDTAEFAGLVHRLAVAAPWLPVCLVTDDADPRTAHARMPLLPDGVEFHPAVLHSVPHAALDGMTAFAAIARRPPPGPQALARWITIRLERPQDAPLLARALAAREPGESPADDRKIRRHLSRLSALQRHEWCRLAALATVPRPRFGVDAMAGAMGVKADGFRRWVRRLVGCRAGEFRYLPGWESVLELALRRVVPQRLGEMAGRESR